MSILRLKDKNGRWTNVPSLKGDKGDTPDLTEYAKTTDIPSKVSELTNDSGYITGYTEKDPTVPTHVKSITEDNITTWNKGEVAISGTKPATREEVWIDNVNNRIHAQDSTGAYKEFKPWYTQEEVDDLLALEYFDNKVTFNKNVGTIHFTKQGKMVNINYRGANVEHADWVMFTLPEGYRPPRTVYFFAVDSKLGSNIYSYIDAYGTCVCEYTGTARLIFNISFATELGTEK